MSDANLGTLANPWHTGGDEYQYLYTSVALGRRAGTKIEHEPGVVCKVTRSESGSIVSLRFHHGPAGFCTVLHVEKCFAALVAALVPVEKAPDPNLYGRAQNRHHRRQILAMRLSNGGLDDDSGAWIVGLRDAGILASDIEVERLINHMSEVPEDASTYQHLIEYLIKHCDCCKLTEAHNAAKTARTSEE